MSVVMDEDDLDAEIEDELDEILTLLEEAKDNLDPPLYQHLLKRVVQECKASASDEDEG